MNLPVTSMLPINASPHREFIVSDPSRLTYFKAANAVRAGTYHTWGALQGLGFGETMEEQSLRLQRELEGGTAASANTTKTGGALQTVGDLIGNIGRSLLGPQSAPPPVMPAAPPPSPVPYILVGAGALAVGGFIVYKLMK